MRCGFGIAAVCAFASSHWYVCFCAVVGLSPVVPGQLTPMLLEFAPPVCAPFRIVGRPQMTVPSSAMM